MRPALATIVAALVLSSCSSAPPTSPSGPIPPLGGSIGGGLIVFAPMNLFPGDSADATASVTSTKDGVTSIEPTAQATWTSANRSVATITPAGRVTAIAPGTSTLTATYQDKSASVVLVVSNPNDIVGIDLKCPASLQGGELGVCVAAVRTSAGGDSRPKLEWSSTRPDVVTIDTAGIEGVVIGHASGEARITASYRNLQGAAVIIVPATDGLRASTTVEQGSLKPAGGRVTWTMQGSYSVQTAASGRLTVSVTDQTNAVLSTESRTVARGGESFLFNSAFDIPAASTRVCQMATLGVGTATLGNESTTHCRSVTP